MIVLLRVECCDCRAFQILRTISDASSLPLCADHKDSTVLTMILFNVTVLQTTCMVCSCCCISALDCQPSSYYTHGINFDKIISDYSFGFQLSVPVNAFQMSLGLCFVIKHSI